MADTARWLSYDFHVYPRQVTWSDVPGVYVFAGITPANHWKAYYIGQADSFQNRLPSHERWEEAVLLGASHIHAMSVQESGSRDTIESELILAYRPPLNTQLR